MSATRRDPRSPARRLRRSAAALCVAGATLIAPSVANADDAIATLRTGTPIAAFGGVVAWSDYDTSIARFRLVIYRSGVARPAPVAASVKSFDVSLGPDASGRVVALYTRCAKPAPVNGNATGCDVYRYDVRSGRERKLGSVSSPEHDEAWPAQSRGRVVFVRRARSYVKIDGDRRPLRGKPKGSVQIECDVPYVKTLTTPGPSRRLDRATCGTTTGMAIHRDTIAQVSSDAESPIGSESQVRLLRARGGSARLLVRAGGGLDGYSPYASPSLSATDLWLTRSGDRKPRNFIRINLATGRMTEVAPNVPLAGRVARDDRGTFWYVQAPEGTEVGEARGCPLPGAPSSPLSAPCRLVRASASPFSPALRTLLPRLQVSHPSTGRLNGLFTDRLALGGRLARDVVRGGSIVRSEPVPGVELELLASRSIIGDEVFTGGVATTQTDAAGAWTIALDAPPPQALLVVVARGLGLAASPIQLFVDANVALSASGTSLAGTIVPAQPGRSVAIQRLDPNFHGNASIGAPPCSKPNAAGQRICPPQAWITTAIVPTSAAGGAFSAAADQPGTYQAVLVPGPTGPGSPDPTGYGGTSLQLQVG